MIENKPSYDDAYCLMKIKDGNEFFFNLIFDKYKSNLFEYLFKILKSKEVAEEIVSDVFIKLWQGKEIITEIQNFEAFIHRVAYNKAIDFFRASKRSPSMQQAIWDIINDVPSTEYADKNLILKNYAALVYEAIDQLSPQRQKVIKLRVDEELSYAEIAQKLQLSTNTVRNHIAASIQFIKEHLAKNNSLFLTFLYFFQKFRS